MARPPRIPIPSTRPPTQLIALTPSTRAHTLITLLLGLEGPKEVTKKDSTKTLLATLHLADETVPTGILLKIWGRQALQTANLRLLDVLQVHNAVAAAEPHGVALRFRGDATVARVPHGVYVGEVGRLVQWRKARFPELLGLLERGRLVSRGVGGFDKGFGRCIKVGMNGTLASVAGNGGMAEIDEVHITNVRIRVKRKGNWDEMDGIRALCRRVCKVCDRRLGEGVCKCGGGGWKWGFGWLLLGLRDGSGEFVVVAEGDVVGRLLCGADVGSIVGDDEIAKTCYRMLEGLVRDGGLFRVIVEGRANGRLALLHLFV